jgi:hypothetical protein
VPNLGTIGGTYATPLINLPEVAIVPLGKVQTLPLCRRGELRQAAIMQVSTEADICMWNLEGSVVESSHLYKQLCCGISRRCQFSVIFHLVELDAWCPVKRFHIEQTGDCNSLDAPFRGIQNLSHPNRMQLTRGGNSSPIAVKWASQ